MFLVKHSCNSIHTFFLISGAVKILGISKLDLVKKVFSNLSYRFLPPNQFVPIATLIFFLCIFN